VSLVDFLFPSFEYHLDESDPDIVLLRRQDDAFVAAFSARGVSRGRASSKRLGKFTGKSCGFMLPGTRRTPRITGAFDLEPKPIHQPRRRCFLGSPHLG
jgi:hypothetical protein